jgi:two-component system response regulator DesR
VPNARPSHIRVAVVQDAPLYRGALAAAIGAEDDLEVVAELPGWREATTMPAPPDLTVLDLGGNDDPLAAAAAICGAAPDVRVLILVDADRHDVLAGIGPDDLHRVGFVTRQASLGHLLSALRSLVAGSAVIDPELVASLLVRPENPLTGREREILGLAAQGVPVDEIARKVGRSPGTVRNCLSRATAKIGADNRADAIARARRAGWL